MACMDEQPLNLVKEASERLPGRRDATARERRIIVSWAHEMAARLEGRWGISEWITLVRDDLNIRTKSGIFTAFEARISGNLAHRMEFRYAPKRVSWLNILEAEQNAMSQLCLSGRRIGDTGALRDEIAASLVRRIVPAT